KVWMLGSGSKGNALVVDADGSRVLIDAGFPARTLQQRLRVAGIAPESIEAAIVTHEHLDHMRGVRVAAKRWGWSFHATKGTVRGCDDLATANVTTFKPGATLSFGAVDVRTV